MAYVELKNLRKSYNETEVIHGLSLSIEEGEFIVIVGPSGCGKSTTLRMIAGLEKITEGEIRFGGKIVNDLRPKERNIAMVFQNYALYPHMTVFQNMAYSLKIAGLSKSMVTSKVNEVAQMLEIKDLLERRPNMLSGGQRQRVAMGRAVVRDPTVFLFDEPLSNLDAKLRGQMRLEIKRLHQELGATSIFVTHDQVEAMTLADRLVVMNDGIAEQIGTPMEVYSQPMTRFVADFIGSPAMNFLEADLENDGQTAKLQDGTVLKLPLRISPRNKDRSVCLGIRPEDITRATKRTVNSLSVKHGIVELLGSDTLIHYLCNNQSIIVRFDKKSVPQDDNLMLQFPEEALHVFDVESGLRLTAT
jgi:sn-glycerol 3-phosphate transport system ATP-binding protein